MVSDASTRLLLYMDLPAPKMAQTDYDKTHISHVPHIPNFSLTFSNDFYQNLMFNSPLRRGIP